MDYHYLVSYNTFMQKLCLDCLYIGEDEAQYNCNMKSGLKWLVVGVLSIALLFLTPYLLIISWFIIIRGLIYIYRCFEESNKCPKCNNTTMINVEGDHAKRIIAENNLVVPPHSGKPKKFLLGPNVSWIVFGGINLVVTMLIFALLIALVL